MSETREEHLMALLRKEGREPQDPRLAAIVEDAQILGSLELAGVACSWEAVRASRESRRAAPEADALRRARSVVPLGAPITIDVIRTWHAAIAGRLGFRSVEREREGVPSSPPELIASRLGTLEDWLCSAGVAKLKPTQAAALAYSRIEEILPFDDGNGRVARLAASHLMVGGGMRPPILVGADGPYLVACLRAAFRLDTAPLVQLFEDASTRAVEAMIQSLERGEA